MNAQDRIKWLLVARAKEWEAKIGDDLEYLSSLTTEEINDLYEELEGEDDFYGVMSEMREGDEETGLPSPYSRHYESKEVAAKCPDGVWVGWTYWYGGGKHGEPEAIDWISDAYVLDCKEEEKMVVVRTFKKKEKE